MSYLIVYPRRLELLNLTPELVQGQLTYGIEAYGIFRTAEKCEFRMKKMSGYSALPDVVVEDPVLSKPLYAKFWHSFYFYVRDILGLPIFDKSQHLQPKTILNEIYINNVCFEVNQKGFDDVPP